MDKFTELFLAAAWIIFISTGRSMSSSIIMIAAGTLALIEIVSKIHKEKLDCVS